MVSNRWIEGRRVHWDRLEALMRTAQGGLHRLSGSELQELGLLYRQTAADLSVATQNRSSTQIAAYLNHLLGKSHNLLYSGERPTRKGVLAFYRDIYPKVFREMLPLTGTATAIFFIAAVVGWAISLRDPGFAYRILGPQVIDSIEQHKMWTESVVAIKPVASSFITTNNLSVVFTTVALGITGIGTIWMMIFNGLLLGVV
jgi:Stage II sporulation protein M